MPSLLQKLSFFDPEVGRYFIVADGGFYWKEAKKSPEDSKVTRLMAQYGWELKSGNDVWLIFSRRGQRGEVTVIRGEKRWYYDQPGDDFLADVPEGQGLDSLQQALEGGVFGGRAKAMHASAPSTAVNNAGNGSAPLLCDPTQAPDDPLFEHRVGKTAMRPDYGSGYSAITNDLCEDEREEYLLELKGGCKTGSVASPASLYVTGAKFRGLSLERFTFGPDRAKAAHFARITALDLGGQIMGKFGVSARMVLSYDYREMFKAVFGLMGPRSPYSEKFVNEQIDWAKRVLKKQDRVIWFLRLVRLAIVQDMMGTASLSGELNPRLGAAPAVALPGNTVQRTEQATPPPQQPQQKQQKPQETREETWANKVRALYQQYGKELRAKGGNPGAEMGVLADLNRHKRDLEHFYGLNAPEIMNYSPVGESFVKLYDVFAGFEQKWKEQAKSAIRPQAEDKIWMQFPDGWAWHYLPRASCDAEAKAMGHCGNSPFAGAKGMGILSLRKPVKRGQETLWEPHLTFIVHQEPPGSDGGILGEMKGKGNDKPAPQYHPYIIALLKDQRIKGIAGGGYLATHNFSFGELSEQQQAEVNAANPGVGLEPQAYYDEFGMDENLISRVRAILGWDDLEKHPYMKGYGFVAKTWEDERAFLKDVGSSEMANAYDFVQTGQSDYDDPDIDDLLGLVAKIDEAKWPNIARELQYEHPKEIEEWYADWNPDADTDTVGQQIRMALIDLFETKVQPHKKKQDAYRKQLSDKIWELDRAAEQDDEMEESGPLKEKLNKIRTEDAYSDAPVLKKLYDAWTSGGPDVDYVQEMMTEAMEEAERGHHVEFIKDKKSPKWFQVETDENAVFTAQQHVSQQGDAGYYEPEDFDVHFPYDWDQFDDERALESANHYFQERPKRPKVKGQPRLFTEPRSEAEAKRKGITVSSLTHPLLKKAAYTELPGELAALKAKYEARGVTVELAASDRNGPTVSLDSIVVPKGDRDQGIGSAFMEELVRWADANGATLFLTPSKDFGATSVGRLRSFYGQFGFKRNLGRNKDFRSWDAMVRQPKTARTVTAKPGDLLTTQNIKTQKQPPKMLTEQNEKTQKGETKGYLTGIMHLMPSDLSGAGNVCPYASPECRAHCLNTAGAWANAPAVQNSRRMKTELYFKDREQFMKDMRRSVAALVRKAEREDLIPAIRINGTSDLPHIAQTMAKEFPQVQFYDYTKIPQPWKRQMENYHITFSRSEINEKEAMASLEHGVNVAVVFELAKGAPLPEKWKGFQVIDGDVHDLRFLDKQEGEGPFIVGLRAKGKARGKGKGSDTGFVQKVQPLTQIAPAPAVQEAQQAQTAAAEGKPCAYHYAVLFEDEMFS
jgi:GNAT superfamily N-acetyltransferase